MNIFKQICSRPEFGKDLKKLSKRFMKIEEDLQIFIDKQLNLYHKLKIDNGGIVQVPDLHIEIPKIYKARKFACRALKGKGSLSGIRIIYAYFEVEDKIEFIEIYYKGDKGNEDRARILRNYSKR
jgi:hypothetical protein